MTARPVVATIALAAIASVISACGSTPTGNRVSAYLTCEHAVESQLRAPATADFSGIGDSTINTSGSTYDIAGYVDAQNGFGANIRTNWTCSVSGDGDNWELLDLNVS